jgi:hypothetical protein
MLKNKFFKFLCFLPLDPDSESGSESKNRLNTDPQPCKKPTNSPGCSQITNLGRCGRGSQPCFAAERSLGGEEGPRREASRRCTALLLTGRPPRPLLTAGGAVVVELVVQLGFGRGSAQRRRAAAGESGPTVHTHVKALRG